MYMDPKIEMRKLFDSNTAYMMLLRHPFVTDNLLMIQTFLILKLFKEMPTKLLKLSNNMEI